MPGIEFFFKKKTWTGTLVPEFNLLKKKEIMKIVLVALLSYKSYVTL